MPGLAARLRELVRTLGPLDAALFVADRLLGIASRGRVHLTKYYFVAQPVAPAGPAARAGAVRLYVAQAADAVIAQAPRPAAVLAQRFAQHSRCVVAERDGKLAGFIWLCPSPYREDMIQCVYRWRPEARAQWDYDVYIEPEHRMGRLFVRLWAAAHDLLRSEGVAWTLSRIDAFNAGSLAAHRKLGAREIGRAVYLVAGRWQVMVASQAPRWHLCGPGRDAPTLHFDLGPLTEPPSPA